MALKCNTGVRFSKYEITNAVFVFSSLYAFIKGNSGKGIDGFWNVTWDFVHIPFFDNISHGGEAIIIGWLTKKNETWLVLYCLPLSFTKEHFYSLIKNLEEKIIIS